MNAPKSQQEPKAEIKTIQSALSCGPANAAGNDKSLENPIAGLELMFHKFALDQAAIVAVTDARGRITSVNDKFCEISKYSREELIGQDHRILNSGRHPKEHYRQMYATIARGKIWKGEFCNRAKDGSLYWVDTTILPIISNHSSHIAGYIAVRYDITQFKKVQENLLLAKEMAEAAARTKAEFLANMSHEIRTPMTAIIGYADLLSDPSHTPEERAEFVQTIRRNGEHLLCIINDIMDISKIEAGKLQVEHIAFDPGKIVADVESSMRIRAMERGISSCVKYHGAVPEQIHSDPTRLRQILLNLVSNAVKFTKEGGIRIDVRYDADHRKLEISVSDTGIGLSPEQMSALFQPFAQADGSTTRRFGGTGLGLVLCKRLVEALGGTITVKSERGKGSAFGFTIDNPVRCDDQCAPAENNEHESSTRRGHAPRRLRGRVLLVEDGADNRRLVSIYLEAAGLQVDTAVDGAVAIKMIFAAQETGRGYDAVLMDMQMPEMDGYTATAEVRHHGITDLPIIAFTANVLGAERQKCLDSGCNDFSTKPVNPEALIQTLAKYIHRTRKRGEKAKMITLSSAPAEPGIERPAQNSASAAPLPDGVVRSQYLDRPAVRRVLPEYIAGLSDQVEQIRNALAQHDLDVLRRLVHQLRGSGGAYGFPDVTRLATIAESAINEKTALEEVSQRVGDLVEFVARVEGFDAAAKSPSRSQPQPADAKAVLSISK